MNFYENIITKIVRPGLLIWFSLVFTSIMILDGNFKDFTIKEIYIHVLETILVAMITAYFLGRSGEKIMYEKKINKRPDLKK